MCGCVYVYIYVYKTLHFNFRMYDTVIVIQIKQLLHLRENLCVCQHSMDIVYFTRCSISDADTTWIFIESHKKNYCHVDGK